MEDRVVLVVVTLEAVEAVPMVTVVVGNVIVDVLLKQMSSPTMTASSGQQGSFPHWGSVQ